MTASVPYIGSKISLVSNSDIRYEGILYTINTQESTIALQSVHCCGTEGRKVPEIPPSSEIYDFIIFRGQDIKDLTVLESANPLSDPAIMSVNQRPPGGPSKGKESCGGKGGYGYEGGFGAGGGAGGYSSGYGSKGGGGAGGYGAPAKAYGKGSAAGGTSSWGDWGASNAWDKPDSRGAGAAGYARTGAPSYGAWGDGYAKGGGAGKGEGYAKGGGAQGAGYSSKGPAPKGGKGGKVGGKDAKGGKGFDKGGKGFDKGGKGGKGGGGGGQGGGSRARGMDGAGAPIGELLPSVNQAEKSKYAEDFDYEGANEKFDKEELKEAEVEDKLKPRDGYDKGKSFFDNISCEATDRAGDSERPKIDRNKARQNDQETFGDTRRPPRPTGARRGGKGPRGWGR